MKLEGEIILIDKDPFEQKFLKEVLERLKYDVCVKYFPTAKDGYDYLRQTDIEIFLIISEMDFDRMNGLQLKEAINNHEHTKWKSAPFIFIANNLDKKTTDAAYKLDIHGFFKKPDNLWELTNMFSVIIQYWIMNWHPNKSETSYA
jgi:DNA-binding NtrC family response regulator